MWVSVVFIVGEVSELFGLAIDQTFSCYLKLHGCWVMVVSTAFSGSGRVFFFVG